jgi:hypothetical protein
MVGEAFRPRDLLGRPIGEAMEWEAAESAVRVVLVADDLGVSQVVGASELERWELSLPLDVALTPLG